MPLTTEQELTRLAVENERLREALRPFVTARFDSGDDEKIVDWFDQHDADGVCLVWDPEFTMGSTLVVGQFKRARTAYEGDVSEDCS